MKRKQIFYLRPNSKKVIKCKWYYFMRMSIVPCSSTGVWSSSEESSLSTSELCFESVCNNNNNKEEHEDEIFN